MSEEKSYGQVMWESAYGAGPRSWADIDEEERRMCEKDAQAVIDEFLRRIDNKILSNKEHPLTKLCARLADILSEDQWLECLALLNLTFEYMYRNGEPIAWMLTDHLGKVWFEQSEPTKLADPRTAVIACYAAPQPLPSVDEIAGLLSTFQPHDKEHPADCLPMANAVLGLLKGKQTKE